jgi:hypothetical protein
MITKEYQNVITTHQASRDTRDAGAGPTHDLFQVADEKEGRALCNYLNALAVLASQAFFGPDKTPEEREAAEAPYREKIQLWDHAFNCGYETTYRVDRREIPQMVDLAPFREIMAK